MSEERVRQIKEATRLAEQCLIDKATEYYPTDGTGSGMGRDDITTIGQRAITEMVGSLDGEGLNAAIYAICHEVANYSQLRQTLERKGIIQKGTGEKRQEAKADKLAASYLARSNK